MNTIIISIKQISNSTSMVFSDRRYLIISLLFAILIFTILILMRVGRISDKAFYYQVTSLDNISLAVITFFAIIAGILLSMNIYIFARRTHTSKRKSIGGGIMSIFSSIIAGIFGSGVCIACISILFGFLGLPTITFLLAYRREFFLVSALIALLSLYLASKAIREHETCKMCKS